jgi:hypothetical protein
VLLTERSRQASPIAARANAGQLPCRLRFRTCTPLVLLLQICENLLAEARRSALGAAAAIDQSVASLSKEWTTRTMQWKWWANSHPECGPPSSLHSIVVRRCGGAGSCCCKTHPARALCSCTAPRHALSWIPVQQSDAQNSRDVSSTLAVHIQRHACPVTYLSSSPVNMPPAVMLVCLVMRQNLVPMLSKEC